MTHSDTTLQTRKGLGPLVLFVIAGIVAAAFMYAGAAHSFPGKRHGGIEARIEKLMDRLDVNDEQREQIRSIMDTQRPAYRGLHDRMKENRQAFRKLDPTASSYDAEVQQLADTVAQQSKELMVLIADGRKQIWQVLTESQREQATALWQEHRERRFGKH